MLINPIDLDDTGFADAVEDRSAASQKSSSREPQHLRHRVVSCAWVVAVFIACAVAFGLFISERERLATWNHFSFGGTRTSSSRVTGRAVATGGVHHAGTRTGEHEGEETAFSTVAATTQSSFRARSASSAAATTRQERESDGVNSFPLPLVTNSNDLSSVSTASVSAVEVAGTSKLRSPAVPQSSKLRPDEKRQRKRAWLPRRRRFRGVGGQHQIEVEAKEAEGAASALQTSEGEEDRAEAGLEVVLEDDGDPVDGDDDDDDGSPEADDGDDSDDAVTEEGGPPRAPKGKGSKPNEKKVEKGKGSTPNEKKMEKAKVSEPNEKKMGKAKLSEADIKKKMENLPKVSEADKKAADKEMEEALNSSPRTKLLLAMLAFGAVVMVSLLIVFAVCGRGKEKKKKKKWNGEEWDGEEWNEEEWAEEGMEGEGNVADSKEQGEGAGAEAGGEEEEVGAKGGGAAAAGEGSEEQRNEEAPGGGGGDTEDHEEK